MTNESLKTGDASKGANLFKVSIEISPLTPLKEKTRRRIKPTLVADTLCSMPHH
jgi:hypothetical protein